MSDRVVLLRARKLPDLLKRGHGQIHGVDQLGGGMGIASLPVKMLLCNLQQLITRRHGQAKDQKEAQEEEDDAEDELSDRHATMNMMKMICLRMKMRKKKRKENRLGQNDKICV